MENSFFMKDKDWRKLQNYAQAAYDMHKSEIGGMLVAVEDDDGDWHLKDPVILKQEISATNCVLDKDALALYYCQVAAKMKKRNFRFVWWHSHHTMKAFWSATDLQAIEEYSDGDFSFALVINLDEEYLFRVSVWEPFEMHEDVDIEFTDAVEKKLPKRITDEVDDLCGKLTPTYTYNKSNYNYKSNQQTLWTMQDEDSAYSHACDGVETFLKRMATGYIDYDTFKRGMERLNEELVKNYKGVWQVLIEDEETLNSTIMYNSAADYIKLANAKDVEPEEYKEWMKDKADYSSYLEDAIDVDEIAWNNSFDIRSKNDKR